MGKLLMRTAIYLLIGSGVVAGQNHLRGEDAPWPKATIDALIWPGIVSTRLIIIIERNAIKDK